MLNKFIDRLWYKPDEDRQVEKLDPKPIAVPVGMKRPETLAEQVARLVRTEQFLQSIGREDYDTFDEANDFDFDDEDPFSPYETIWDPVLNMDVSPHDFLKNQGEYRKRYLEASDGFQEELPTPIPEPSKKSTQKQKKPVSDDINEGSDLD